MLGIEHSHAVPTNQGIKNEVANGDKSIEAINESILFRHKRIIAGSHDKRSLCVTKNLVQLLDIILDKELNLLSSAASYITLDDEKYIQNNNHSDYIPAARNNHILFKIYKAFESEVEYLGIDIKNLKQSFLAKNSIMSDFDTSMNANTNISYYHYFLPDIFKEYINKYGYRTLIHKLNLLLNNLKLRAAISRKKYKNESK